MKTKYWKYLGLIATLSIWCDAGSSVATTINNNTHLNNDVVKLTTVSSSSMSAVADKQSDTVAAVIVVTGDGIQHFNVTSISESQFSVPDSQISHATEMQSNVTSRSYWNILRENINQIGLEHNPGITLWGANAANRAITRSPLTTDEIDSFLPAPVSGGLHNSLIGGIGYGVQIPEFAYAHAYFKYHRHDFYEMLNNSGDNLDSYHTGFQIDENRSKVSSWTLQGDMNFINENRGSLPSWLPGYTSRLGNYDAVDAYGGAINGSWKKNFSGSNPWTLGFQHTLAVGIGYQLADIEFTNRHAVSETPINRMRNLYDSFIQDRIPLAADSLKLILGVKQMHNDYSGNEMQPMGHLLWKLNNHHSLWTSASRMVQTSAGIEEDGNTESATDSSGFLFFEPHILNLQDFDSEALTAYEAGYHWLPNSQFTGDLTFFYNNHQRLLPSNGLFQEAFDDSYFHNTFQGTTHGFDCSLDWQLLNGLDFLVDYTLVGFDPEKSPYGMNTAIEKSLEDTGAGHLISLQSIYNMSNNLQLGLNGRYTGSLKTAQNILLQGETNGGSLLDMDANIRWQATRNLELKLIGKNLFNNGGLKVVSQETTTLPIAHGRSLSGNITYHF